jgi:hypothetical protein
LFFVITKNNYSLDTTQHQEMRLKTIQKPYKGFFLKKTNKDVLTRFKRLKSRLKRFLLEKGSSFNGGNLSDVCPIGGKPFMLDAFGSNYTLGLGVQKRSGSVTHAPLPRGERGGCPEGATPPLVKS